MQPEYNRNAPPSSVRESTIDSSKEAVPKRRLGGRSTRVQVAVFNATMELLLTESYDAITITEIASRSGVHETSIYRRWKTKEALVIEVLLERAKEIFPIPDTGSVRSDLVQLLQEVIAFLQSPIGEIMVKISTGSLHIAAMSPERQHYWSSRFEQFNTIVERAIERGEFPPQTDEHMLLKTLIGPLYVQIFLLNQPLDESLPGRIVDLVLSGAINGGKTASGPPGESPDSYPVER
jgi:AcrR family transcriptional regulator